jgi:hypothetical protein
MELVKYIFDKLNTQYPNKCIVGAAERDIDDSILIYEVQGTNKKTKENQRVGDVGVMQITRHANTQMALMELYDWCVINLIPDKINVQSCVVDSRLFSTFENGSYRIDIRVNISK